MRRLDGITAQPRQRLTHTLENGDVITLRLVYRPAVQMWFMSVEWEGFELNGVRVTKSPNMLEQYRNIIPFGILCNVSGGEPTIGNDFSSGRAVLFVLSELETEFVAAYYTEAAT